MRWWACTWSRGELCDVERTHIRQPDGEKCKDLPPIHVCILYALNLDQAISKARAKHPEFPDTLVEFKDEGK